MRRLNVDVAEFEVRLLSVYNLVISGYHGQEQQLIILAVAAEFDEEVEGLLAGAFALALRRHVVEVRAARLVWQAGYVE